ncbi:MAG: bifunctional riboflavin kinase/FAD synthetase [Phenylobacterium sp.]|uniref:bifunctional riboflavin kinase/FAD synthetase n=1 Tax=Phenylobacterium sp. TaxID=1871053 RepID=UPI002730A4EC|nr:bifunctional riboflavin kinase/FAD synthetase [Phenylobacterium sp.]MDP2011178.1 bifunctional riboflavin kinase/FAD synthetase [Phenylobacterium sp.]MDP3634893.1 bifunctional riboflavin kinase/FAD synthetase [Phenylobacterium sp.]MDP3867440.1 bifunctional riboflavin kinase/FAD synthetase [Phenylobacterium sp.]
MRIVHDWKGLADTDRGAAVALGNFDGVHRGHQQVIALAAKAAGQLKAPLGVISFDPHPRRIFQPDSPSFRLMQPDQQARALAGLGVDISYVLPFTQEFAEMTDREFVVEVLHKGLGVRDVAVGFDISFGKGRTGSPETMARYGEELGFGVSVAQAVGEGNAKFSSTAVREVLRDGHPELAASILGRPFAIEGVVERGRQLGRTLGYPTANVDLRDYVLPRFGVYATRTRLPDGREIAGVANIGVSPMIDGMTAPRLEVWMFDFDEDIYDQVIETDLIAFLRDEARFASMDAMTAQIVADAAQARALLLPEI